MREYETFLETKEFHLKNIIVHEKYERRVDKEKEIDIYRNDIALLELEEEVDLSVYTPVCLPSSVRNRDNTPALAIGKGRVHLILFIIWKFMEFTRNDHNYNPGWGKTAGRYHPNIDPTNQTICNSTG